jgi:hypothetical protein
VADAQPGGLIAAFSVQPGRCFRMVYDYKLHATHCRQEPSRKGPWKDATGRSWYVQACKEHAPNSQRSGSLLSRGPGAPRDPGRPVPSYASKCIPSPARASITAPAWNPNFSPSR